MAEEKIILTIDEDGGVSAKTHGFKGQTCLEALDDIIGEQTVTNIKTTDEFRQKIRGTNHIRLYQGKK